MTLSLDESTLSSSFSSVVRELENLLSPAARTLRVGVESKWIVIIDIAWSMKIEHTSTFGRGGASTGVIYIGVIPIHHIIWVFYGNGAGSGKSGDSDNSIVSSSSLSYRVRTTNFTKEDILQRRLVCVKNKHGPGCSRERNIHHASATKGQLQTFGSEKHFSPKNSERWS